MQALASQEVIKAFRPQENSTTGYFITAPLIRLDNGTIVEPFLVGQFNSCTDEDGKAYVDPHQVPRVEIDYDESRAACTKAGGSLITLLQAYAISVDISRQPENWTGGEVGKGEIFKGLHKGSIFGAKDGNFESPDPQERRWHVLSNGERIYDWAGHLFSWMQAADLGDDDGLVNKPFHAGHYSLTIPFERMTHGMGWIPSLPADWSGHALVRGGCWGSGDNAGVFHLRRGWRDYRDGVVSFRCTKSLG